MAVEPTFMTESDSAEGILNQSGSTPQTPQTLERSHGKTERELKVGDIVGDRYIVISRIGRGGNGSVYRVRQKFLDKELALKTLKLSNALPLTVMRFQQEAQAAGRLSHKNIVRAIDFGVTQDGEPYLVMDLVEGKTLARILRKRGRLPLAVVTELFIPLSQAMAYAHANGVIHRDLKPSNIVLEPDAESKNNYIPKIIDFGLAKIDRDELVRDQHLTKRGDIVGTPLYMSPEQCLAKEVDNRSDIYSLGCVLFECLTGVPPFQGENQIATMQMHASAEIPSLEKASGGLEFSNEINQLVTTMLAKDPGERLQSFDVVAEGLIAIREHQSRDGSANLLSEAISELVDERKTFSVSQAKPLIALSVVVSLLIFAFTSWSIFARQTSDSKKINMPVQAMFNSPEVDGSPAEQVVIGSEPISKTAGNLRIFKFPNQDIFGSIYFYDGNNFKHVDAIGSVEIPENSKRILRSGKRLLNAPEYSAQFRDGDYHAFEMAPDLIYQPDDNAARIVLSNLLKVRTTNAILLNGVKVDGDNLKNIGNLPGLRCLIMNDCEFHPEDVAGLPNLDRLNALYLSSAPRVSPIIEKLVEKNVQLVRLNLTDCHLSTSDISQISRMGSIKVLALPFNSLDPLMELNTRKRIMAPLARLTELEVFCADYDVLPSMPLESWKNLSIVYLTGIEEGTELPRALRKRLPEKCKIRKGRKSASSIWRDYFNPKSCARLWIN